MDYRDKMSLLDEITKSVAKYDGGKFFKDVKYVTFSDDLDAKNLSIDVVVELDNQDDKRKLGSFLSDLTNKYKVLNLDVVFHQYEYKDYILKRK